MSLGDDEHPISVAFEPRMEGAHVKVVVRAGLRGMRGLAGELTFRPEEWAVLAHALGALTEVEDRLGVMLRYAPEGHKSRLNDVKLVYLDTDPIEVDALNATAGAS